MNHKIVIPERLPGMNEWIAAQNSNRFKGAQMKKEAQQLCCLYIKKSLNITFDRPVILHYTFYEKNKRRDHDNVSGFAHKIIQDALVECDVLKDDGWDEIVGYTDIFKVDKNNPRIELIMEEL